MSISWYELLRGPLLSVLLIVVVIFHVYRIYQFFHATTRLPDVKNGRQASGKIEKKPGKKKGLFRTVFHNIRIHFRNTIFGINPVAVWTTAVYHLIIFAALFLVEGHNVLIDLSWGIQLPALSEEIMNILTMVMLGISTFYFLRRSTVGKFWFPIIFKDYLAILITAGPFITGLMAHQQWFNYDTVIICHMLSGMLFFLMLPVSKMGHLLFFVFGRFFLSGELNLVGGRRVWKTDYPLQKLAPTRSADTQSVDVEYVKYLLDHKKTQMKVMMTFCSRCSNCADSCFLYIKTGDRSYIPSHKVFNSIGKLYRKRGQVSHEELEEIADTVWNKCVLCERCYCPVGLKIPDMIALGRSICRSQGIYRTYDDSFHD